MATIDKVISLRSWFAKRDNNTLTNVQLKTRHLSKGREDLKEQRHSELYAPYDDANVISKSSNDLDLIVFDKVMEIADKDINSKGKEDHRKGTTLSNSRKNFGTEEHFASERNELPIVDVELLEASDKSRVESKEPEAFPKVRMGN